MHLDGNTQKEYQHDAITLLTTTLCRWLCVFIICTIIMSFIPCVWECVRARWSLFTVDESTMAYWTTIVLCVTKTTLSLSTHTHTHTHTLPGWLTYRHFTVLTSTNWIRVHSLCTSTLSHTDTMCTSTRIHTRTQTRSTQQAQNGRNAAVRLGLSVASKVTEQREKGRCDKEGVCGFSSSPLC